ncbi:sigma-70 family RNA polymerase sigma factor [Demequina sp.]|uniref:sigma-70 family RNA polymerase sigma factor n=1 Tax=Demequina sp. TaxID=2050685 RepID=UPI003D0D5A74
MATWPAVLDELMRTRRGALVGYAALLTGDVAAAEDVVHDAIVKSFSRGRGFAHVNQADAYVRRAIVSVFIDRARRDARFREAAPALAGNDVVPVAEGSVDLDRALASLSPQLRAVVVLRFFDDLTVPQIASSMGLADGTVKRYLHEAQGVLAGVYTQDPAEEAVEVVVHKVRRGS